MTGPPTTTARRMRRLLGTLALPWVVCGGPLWAAVWATAPDVTPDGGVVIGRGVQVEVISPGGRLPWLRVQKNLLGEVRSNMVGFDEPPGPPVAGRLPGLSWVSGDSSVGRWMRLDASLRSLLPIPLLWSGFNLWRWFRRSA